MNSHDNVLTNILGDTGTIGKLRERIIALLLIVEEISAASDSLSNEDSEHAQELIKKLELLLNEFSDSQKIADKVLADLSPSKRITIQKEAPDLFDIFGWHNKINENGDLMDIIL